MIDFHFDSVVQFFMTKIAWLLFHSLWQIALIAILFVITRWMIRGTTIQEQASASARIYLLGCIALGAMVVAPLMTLLVQHNSPIQEAAAESTMFPELVDPFVIGSSESRFLALPNPEVTSIEFAAVKSMPASPRIGWFAATATWLESGLSQMGVQWGSLQPWIVAGWLIGVLLFSLRPILGLREVSRLRHSMSEELPQSLFQLGSKLATELNVSSSINFATSQLAKVPLVIGCFRPVVLLPVSMLTELSTQQIELIIRHELAHVRRHDIFVNLFQLGVESMFFFHPCMWLVSNAVRQERENCCDDIAIANGNADQYANALVAVEKARQPAIAMASNGGQLLPRIERILKLNTSARNKSWLESLVPIAMLVGFMAVFAMQSVLSAAPQSEVVKHRLIKHNFSKTKLGKSLELELKKLDQTGFNGAVLVAHNGEIILATSEGHNDQEKKQEISPKSLFEIASITKSFTSTAALVLAEQGKLELDASIAEYLPNVPESSRSITVRHLMQHRSGIPGDSYGVTNEGLEVAVETMLGDGPVNQPGSKFEYWNQGYILLSEIVAKAGDEPFVDVVRKLIFEPANMQGSCFTGDSLPKDFFETVGYGDIGAPRSCLEHPYGSYGLQYRGTGGVVTNIFDMWKFHHALQHNQLLSSESVAASIDVGDGEDKSPYGLGWFVRSIPNGDPCISHGGSVRGFNGEFRRYPKSDSCIVVLSNNDNSPSRMVAGLIEGILFPPDPETVLTENEVEAFSGTYMSREGRMLVIENTNKKAIYNIYWSPGNPNGPVSRGYVQRNEKGNLIFYQSNEVSKVKAKFSADKSKVREIRYHKMKFVRDKDANANAAGAAARRELPDPLAKAEMQKFVGNYKTGFGPILEVERSEGFLIFKMHMDEKNRTEKPLVGYLRKYKDGDYVLYHPTSPLTINFELSADNQSVVEITANEINMKFQRED